LYIDDALCRRFFRICFDFACRTKLEKVYFLILYDIMKLFIAFIT